MELTSVKCLINSISRFVHLVTCRVSKSLPGQKDFEDTASILKLLKPTLDDAVDNQVPLDEPVCRECEELDLAINEAREFLENYSSKKSKILSALQSKLLLLKIQTLSLEISHVLCGLLEPMMSSLSLSDTERRIHEFYSMKSDKLLASITDALQSVTEGKIPSSEHLTTMINLLALTSPEELLNECIALEKERLKAEENRSDNLERINDAIEVVSHIRNRMLKLDSFTSTDNINIPPYFRCPLSLAFMSDPVIIASGQTFERASIQKWMDSGLTTCPRTRQSLSHSNLIPNVTVRAMIENWCEENKAKFLAKPDVAIEAEKSDHSSPEHSCVHSRTESTSSVVSSVDYTDASKVSTRHDNGSDDPITTSRVEELITDLTSQSTDAQAEAAAELRFLAKHKDENRVIIGKSGAIDPLISLLHSESKTTQEHAVTALLNLSINEKIKAVIAEKGALEPLIHVLRTGNPGARENAAAAIFSISLLEEYRVKIGRSGAVKALVDLLGSGTVRGKKDAATALFNLSIFHENKARIVQAGAVRHLVEFLDPGTEMVDKSVALLANLATVSEGCSAIAREGGIPPLVEIVDLGSQRGKENAASILLQLCLNSPKYCKLVLQEGAVPPLVALSQCGSTRAKEKAQQLLSHFRNQREGATGRAKS